MIRFFTALALLALPFMPVAAQAAPGSPGGAGIQDAAATLSSAPYKAGDMTIALLAGLHLPLAFIGSPLSTQLDPGAGFGFSYRYFLDGQWAIGGDISGAFNGTIGGNSLFTAPLSFEFSWWKAVVPFEFTLEAGLGGYITRLKSLSYVGPFAKLGGAALWRTGTGWSVGLRVEGWAVPEIHIGTYADETRTAIFLHTGLIAVYHI
jgi:hypothetical protein